MAVAAAQLFGEVLGVAGLSWTVRTWAEQATGDRGTNRELRNTLMDPLEIPVFSVLVAGLGLGISLLLAVMADRIVRGSTVYKTLLKESEGQNDPLPGAGPLRFAAAGPYRAAGGRGGHGGGRRVRRRECSCWSVSPSSARSPGSRAPPS